MQLFSLLRGALLGWLCVIGDAKTLVENRDTAVEQQSPLPGLVKFTPLK
jgi:hypothetical protein